MLTHSYLALHQPGPPVGYCTCHDGDVIWSCPRIETPESLCSVRGPAGHKRVSDFTSRYGQWPLVAGASEGLGAAFAEQLAERGMNVLLVARREPELAELARRLGAGARREHAEIRIQTKPRAAFPGFCGAARNHRPGRRALARTGRRHRCRVLPWDWHRWAGAGGACVLGLAVAAWVVLSAPFLAEYYLGRRKNPRMFNARAAAKMYLYVRRHAVAVELLSFAAHHHMTHPGDLSPGVVLYVMLFTWFICDYLFFERGIPTTCSPNAWVSS